MRDAGPSPPGSAPATNGLSFTTRCVAKRPTTRALMNRRCRSGTVTKWVSSHRAPTGSREGGGQQAGTRGGCKQACRHMRHGRSTQATSSQANWGCGKGRRGWSKRGHREPPTAKRASLTKKVDRWHQPSSYECPGRRQRTAFHAAAVGQHHAKAPAGRLVDQLEEQAVAGFEYLQRYALGGQLDLAESHEGQEELALLLRSLVAAAAAAGGVAWPLLGPILLRPLAHGLLVAAAAAAAAACCCRSWLLRCLGDSNSAAAHLWRHRRAWQRR